MASTDTSIDPTQWEQHLDYQETPYGKFYLFQNDHICKKIKNHQLYEKKLVLKIAQELRTRTPGVILDIGAHIGNWSIALGSQLPNHEIHAFEPLQLTYRLLQKNVETNDFPNVTAHNWGMLHQPTQIRTMGKVDPELILSEQPCNTGGNKLGKNTEVIPIECESIDHFRERLTRPIVFMKIDVETFEEVVIYGGRNTIRQEKPLIVYEELDKPGRGKYINKVSKMPPELYDPKTGLMQFPIEKFLLEECGYSRIEAYGNNRIAYP